jgi:hypothetical protein
MPIYDVHTLEEFYRQWVVASANETLLIINNLSGSEQKISLSPEYQTTYLDLIADVKLSIGSTLTLAPHAHLWLKLTS